jgi:BirA family biotin operon repressor/biotin-[acetyl-CoA-carboxylase] ligase
VIPGDDLADLHRTLGTRRLGRPHEHHAVLDSTNDRALAWLTEGAPHGALVTADVQTAGRGRRGRRWSSPAGDLYASLALRPAIGGRAPGVLAPVGLAVAVGLREGLRALAPGLRVDLKWPNDLLVGDRKLGGILCETVWRRDGPELVLGFGIGVARTEFPPELEPTATSLARLGCAPSGRTAVLAAVLVGLETTLDEFFAHGFAAVRPAYEAACVTLGATVVAPRRRDDGTWERVAGRASALEPDGALAVEPADGGPRLRIDAGDVELQGP